MIFLKKILNSLSVTYDEIQYAEELSLPGLFSPYFLLKCIYIIIMNKDKETTLSQYLQCTLGGTIMRGLEKIGLVTLMAAAASAAAAVTSCAKDYTSSAEKESDRLRDLEAKLKDYERREAEAKQCEEERRAKYISELERKAAKYDMTEKVREEELQARIRDLEEKLKNEKKFAK